MNLKLAGRNSRNLCFMGATLVGFLLWSTVVFAAGEAIERSVDVSATEQIFITIPRGEIQILGIEANRFEVAGVLDEKLERLVFESNDGVTQFEVILPEQYQQEPGSKKAESRLTIKVPLGAFLKAEGTNTDFSIEHIKGKTQASTINGDIVVNKVFNEVEVTTVNGDIKGSEIMANMKMKSVNGDVRLTKAKGVLAVTSVNGDIKLDLVSKQVKAELVNGDIDLVVIEAERAELTNVNGDIEATFTELTSPTIQVSTVNGDATLKLPAKVNAQFELAAKAGGDIDNSFNDLKPQEQEYGPGEWLNFSSGDGKGQVRMTTVNGSLEIEKL